MTAQQITLETMTMAHPSGAVELTRRRLTHLGGGITMRRTAGELKDETAPHRTYALVSRALR